MHIHRQLDQLPDFRQAVVTIGSFDGVHLGHQAILRQLTELAAKVGGESVMVTFDPHPRQVVYPGANDLQLLTTLEEKAALLEQMGIDHLVVVPFTVAFAQQSADEYIANFLAEKLQARYLVIGFDHRFGLNRQGDINYLRQSAEKYKYEVVEIERQALEDSKVSSTRIRKAVNEGDIREANALLGFPFMLSGKVVSGEKQGRKIGYPTANIEIPLPPKIIPPDGVYAARAIFEGQVVEGMLYIGEKPSMPGVFERRIEIHLFGFNTEIYGQRLSVELIDRVRADVRFDSVTALQAQLAEDEQAVKAILAKPTKAAEDLSCAVVVLNYNGRHYLEQFLSILIAHTPEAEIVVADNGSTDGSVDFMRRAFPEVRLIAMPKNYGFAGGYNEALKQVDADLYVLLNSDVEVKPGWLAPQLHFFRHYPEVGASQPKILAHHQKDEFEYAGASGGWMDSLGYPFCRGRVFDQVEKDNGQYDGVQRIFWASGAALCIRAKLFHGLGGFDAEYFAHAEEIDLCWRVKRAGYHILAVPAGTVYHMGGGTLQYDTPRKAYLNFRNTLFTLVKNESFGRLLWMIPMRLTLDGVAGGLFLSQGKWQHIQMIIRAHLDFYRGARAMAKKGRQQQKLIEAYRVGSSTVHEGRLSGSIVWRFYVLGRKKFSELKLPTFLGLPAAQ